MVRFFHAVICSVLLVMSCSMSVVAEPNGPVVLEVTGDLPGGADVSFSLSDLRDIGWQSIETHSPFLEGTQSFAGTPLVDLLAYLNIEEGTLTAYALNNYNVDIPVSDAAKYSVLLAQQHNGDKMRVRDRGPLWIIYPMKRKGSLGFDAERRMVWQLKELRLSR